MKTLTQLTILFFLPLLAQTQPEVLNTSSQTTRATINLAADELTPLAAAPGNTQSAIEAMELSLVNGEVLLRFSLTPLEAERYYRTDIAVRLNGQDLPLTSDEFRGDIGEPIAAGMRSITWINLLDRYINLEGELSVALKVEEWGVKVLRFGVDCNDPPTFTSKQRLPYYIAAGVGVASIGVGQLFKQQSDDVYQNQYLQSETLEQAQDPYNDANGKHHTYLVMTWAGTAILVVDVAWYIYREVRYKKRQKVFEENCDGNALNLKPIFEMPSPTQPYGQAGVQLKWNF